MYRSTSAFRMAARRFGDFLLLCLAAAAVWAVSLAFWEYFGPVAVVVALLLAVAVTNLLHFGASLLRAYPSRQLPHGGEAGARAEL